MDYSEDQGKLWSAAAKDWADLSEPDDRPLWQAMLDSADVSQGTRFLDLGCGAGGASVLAAERGAHIAGLDAAEGLIEIAREHVPGGDFRVGDLGRLPYNDRTFDVTFASLCLMFAANAADALAEMARVTVKGGRVTAGIWGQPDDCDYRHILQAVADLLDSASFATRAFALSGTGIVESLMERAGLTIIDSSEVDAPFLYTDSEMMWRTVRSAGPIQAALQRIGEPQVKSAILRAAEPFQAEKGDIRLNNRFRYVTAIA